MPSPWRHLQNPFARCRIEEEGAVQGRWPSRVVFVGDNEQGFSQVDVQVSPSRMGSLHLAALLCVASGTAWLCCSGKAWNSSRRSFRFQDGSKAAWERRLEL